MTLENRQVLFIFVGALTLCAIFFALGFLVGREQRETLSLLSSSSATTHEKGKQSAESKTTTAPAATNQQPRGATSAAVENELSFYKRVEGKTEPEGLSREKIEKPIASSSSASTRSPGTGTVLSPSTSTQNSGVPLRQAQGGERSQTMPSVTMTPPPLKPTMKAGAETKSVAPPIVFQVAALSKRSDAETLVQKLREQKIFAFLVAPPPNSKEDQLYRVQVGPFHDPAVAEEMKKKLIIAGHHPIVKR